MSDPIQLAFLVAIIAAFVTFGVALLAVSIYVNLPEAPQTEPPRKVIPASHAGAPAVR